MLPVDNAANFSKDAFICTRPRLPVYMRIGIALILQRNASVNGRVVC